MSRELVAEGIYSTLAKALIPVQCSPRHLWQPSTGKGWWEVGLEGPSEARSWRFGCTSLGSCDLVLKAIARGYLGSNDVWEEDYGRFVQSTPKVLVEF